MFSCGNGLPGAKQVSQILIGDELNLSQVSTSEDLLFARHLCDKLRSKRMKLMSLSTVSSSSFDVTLNTTSCDGKKTSNLTKVKVNSNSLYNVIGEFGVFNKYIETDIDGHLASVCTDIFAGLSPLMYNFVSSDEVIQIQIESEDRFAIVYGSKNSSNIYITTDVEIYTFDVKSTDKYLGLNTSFVKKGQCTDPKYTKNSYLKEQIIE